MQNICLRRVYGHALRRPNQRKCVSKAYIASNRYIAVNCHHARVMLYGFAMGLIMGGFMRTREV